MQTKCFMPYIFGYCEINNVRIIWKKNADIIVSGVLSVSLLFHFISYNKEQVNISLIDCLVIGPVFIFRIQLSSQSWCFFSNGDTILVAGRVYKEGKINCNNEIDFS